MNATLPLPSPIAAALLAQRDAIASARGRALLREDCRAAKALADQARALTNEIFRRKWAAAIGGE